VGFATSRYCENAMRVPLPLLAATLFFHGTARPAPVRIVLVGDSTVNDGGGWGPGFRASFTPDVEVANFALNGRSSKSFRTEGAWAKATAQPSAYVLIQFGHNDCPGKGPERETDPNTTFRDNLARYVDEARAAGAKPVLVTSIVRRVFSADGKFKPDTLVPYAEAARRLAAEKNVPLMDMYELTRKQAETLGPAGVAEINPVSKDGKPDATHLNPKGQREIGRIAALEFTRVVPAMRPYLREVAMVVAPDGSGDAKTIQYAIDHAPAIGPAQRLVVQIPPGTYRERVTVPPDRPRVTFRGTDPARTVITYDMSAKAAGGTFFSGTVEVQAPEFEAENITFENTFGVGSQAVALSIHSDRAVLRNCRFIGWQDTLYTASGRQYYKDCYIDGHVDFIFGNATAVFENCHIHSRGAGYITAQSRIVPDGPTGFVFSHCRLTGSDAGKGVYLGRPWRPYSRVIFLDTEMGGHIRPEGWENWTNPENEKTAWYAESGSTGPGARPQDRVKWSRQLTPDQAKQFLPDVFLRGSDNWQPAK
jgi:pectinesterase